MRLDHIILFIPPRLSRSVDCGEGWLGLSEPTGSDGCCAILPSVACSPQQRSVSSLKVTDAIRIHSRSVTGELHSGSSEAEIAYNLFWLFNLVAMAAGPHPFPSRTRSLSPPAPMVLHLMWESRSSPGFFIPNNYVMSILLFKTHSR